MTGPARITQNDKQSLTDNTFIDCQDLKCTGDNLIENISDHLPNVLIMKIQILQITLKKDQENRF